MNNKLVYVPVSFGEGYSMSAQITCNNKKGVEIYLKNAFVLLKSVQKFNPDVDVALVTNFSLPDEFDHLFNTNNIIVYQAKFTEYLMPSTFKWSLAFFKIAAVKWVYQNTDYEYVLQLESDQICISNFDDMWSELDHSFLTMFSPFRLNHVSRQKYTEIFKLIHSNYRGDVICKTGAGFIAGNKKHINMFVNMADEVYANMMKNIDVISTETGDELYTSLF